MTALQRAMVSSLLRVAPEYAARAEPMLRSTPGPQTHGGVLYAFAQGGDIDGWWVEVLVDGSTLTGPFAPSWLGELIGAAGGRS